MEDTLEPIRPNGNRTMNSDCSFLCGRDPSILAFGQRPLPVETDTKKDLESLFEDEELESRCYASSVPSLSGLVDTIKVYLRLRPFPHKAKPNQQQIEAYQIINSTTLLTKLPSLDNTCSSFKKLKANDTVSRKFTFTNTFGPDTTQLQLFEQAVKQQMEEFLNGRSATVMSYGTTNAGKSYTLQGTTASPGIIPRGLEYVFCNINPRSTPCYKPIYNTDVVSLDAGARAYEMELKTKLLSFGSIDKNQYIQAYSRMQQLLQDESPLKPSETSDANYSVWVSFAEIYNETIFDLLSNDCQKKRPSLKLATDKNGKAFIKDLKMVCVNSGSEAYQLLMAGQYNLKVAATALNARSSRSHCIFTIKLLKYHTENSPNDVEVSTFSFCDLAGSERLKKTLNEGERLKEAQNINTSLLVLGRCLKSIFDVQSSKPKHEVIGPFRESKLTRLFQSALSGKEHIALIVNVNPVPNLYIETQNVLNFSAIAKQIVIEPVARKKKAAHCRFSQIVSQSVTTVTDWDVTDLESIRGESTSDMERVEYIDAEDYKDVMNENAKLKKEIAELKSSALNADFAIRQEMSNIYAGIIKNLETNFKNQLQDVEEQQAEMLDWSVKQVEDYYKEQLSSLSQRKRSRISNEDEDEDEINVEELEAENARLEAKVDKLKKSLKELRETKEQLLVDNNKKTFELSLTKKDLQNCRDLLSAAQNDLDCGEDAKKVITELRKQLAAREDQIKSLKEYLNEAKDEWLRVTEVEQKLEESLKKKDAQLLEYSDKLAELTEQLEQVNECLAGSTKTIETLEDKLDVYAKNLSTAEENWQDAEDRWNKSSAKYLVLFKENEELKKTIKDQTSSSKIIADQCTCQEKVLELEKLSAELLQVKAEADELKKKISTKDEMLDTLNSRITASENENVVLKHRLSQSSEHAKLLREELDSTKSTLGDITKQINTLKVAVDAEATNANAVCKTSSASNGEIEVTENLIHIKPEETSDEVEPESTNKTEDENRDSQIISNEESDPEIRNGSKHDETNEKLEQLRIEFNDVTTRFLYSNLRVEALSKELDDAKEELIAVKTSFDASEEKILEYKDVVKTMQDKLRLSDTELAKTTEELEETKRKNELLEKKILDIEEEVQRLQGELEKSQSYSKETSEVLEENLAKLASLENELSESREKLQEITTKCSTEHENHITKLEKDISSAKERDLIKEQTMPESPIQPTGNDFETTEPHIQEFECVLLPIAETESLPPSPPNTLLDAHMQRISKIELELAEAGELREKVTAYESGLKSCEEEKVNLKKLLEENRDKILKLENELQASILREQEKENETISLQKEMKSIIQTSTIDTKRDTEMEKEIKKALRQLTAAQEALAESKAELRSQEKASEEKVLRLEMRLKTFEENASYLALLQEGAEKRQAESEQLRTLNEKLRREIQQKNQELVSFNKNRDETIQRYETLVKQLQEDVDRSKREVSRYQELFLRQSTPTPRKEEIRKLKDDLRSKTSLLEHTQDKLKKYESQDEKENIINTSEDETTSSKETRRTRRGAKNINPPVSASPDVSVIELSGSESKRVTRRTALPPPSTIPSVEKRKTRKKKLFAPVEDTCVDIEPTESTPKSIMRSPLSVTRSLRNRRK